MDAKKFGLPDKGAAKRALKGSSDKSLDRKAERTFGKPRSLKPF